MKKKAGRDFREPTKRKREEKHLWRRRIQTIRGEKTISARGKKKGGEKERSKNFRLKRKKGNTPIQKMGSPLI